MIGWMENAIVCLVVFHLHFTIRSLAYRAYAYTIDIKSHACPTPITLVDDILCPVAHNISKLSYVNNL